MKDQNILLNNGVNLQAALELFGDMQMYEETLNDFIKLIPEKISNLEKYKASSDMPNYAIEVHSIKSDARYLGFTSLADLCYESELKSKAGDIMTVTDNHPKVIAETNRMLNVAKQYLGIAVTAPSAAPTVPEVVGEKTVMGAVPAQMPAAPSLTTTPVVMATSPVVMQTPQMASTQVQTPVQMPQMASTPTPTVMQTPVMATSPVVMATSPVVMATSPVVMQSQTPAPTEPQVVIISSETIPPVITSTPAQTPSPSVQFFPANDMMNEALNLQNQMQAQTPGQKMGTILIIDDSKLVSNFVKKIFEANYDVMTAENGEEGIKILDQDDVRAKIKACLLDLNMPVVDGFAVLEHCKQKGYFVKMPVAIESGVEDTASIERANAYPIVDVLTKPFNERDIKRVIEKCLATYF